MSDKLDINELQAEIGEWGIKTFNQHRPDDHAVLSGIAAHLEDEARELQENPDDVWELVDCFILITQYAYNRGISMKELAYLSKVKFENKLKTRVWGEPDERGVIRHVDGT